jgi:hypothetical protein
LAGAAIPKQLLSLCALGGAPIQALDELGLERDPRPGQKAEGLVAGCAQVVGP